MDVPQAISSNCNAKVLLCIDDDESVLHYQKTALERRGYVVVTSASSRDGLRLAQKGGFDGVILDYDMPDLNGHQLASAIRRAVPDMPIIMFSGYEVPEATRRVVNAVVPKPSVRHFLRTVCDLVTLVMHNPRPNGELDCLQ